MTSRFYYILSICLFLLLGTLVLSTVWDYGLSWDEPHRFRGGQLKLGYYESLYSDVEVPSVYNEKNPDRYPGFFDLTVALIRKYMTFDIVYTGHVMSAIFGLFGILGCWKIGHLLGGTRLAFWSALLITMMPRYYGHMFFNPKDTPFAACYIWGVYFILLAIRELPKVSWLTALKLGMAIGFTTAVRIGGLVLACYLALAMVVYLIMRFKYDRSWLREVLRLFLTGMFVVTIAFVSLIPWWPYAQENIFFSAVNALEYMTQFQWNGLVLFEGKYYIASKLPFYYILKYLLIAVPEVILVLFVSNFCLVFLWIGSRARTLKKIQKKPLCIFILSFSFLFPVVYVIARDAILYDGLRHLLFIIPSMACLSAFALDRWLLRLEKIKKSYAYLFQIIIFAFLSIAGFSMMHLHPYQYVYFNNLAGGLKGAYRKYETDYWSTSSREAVFLLKDFLAKEGLEDEAHTVASSTPGMPAIYYYPENFKSAKNEDEAAFYISTTRYEFHDQLAGKPILVVEREGVPLAVVKDRRGLIGLDDVSVSSVDE